MLMVSIAMGESMKMEIATNQQLVETNNKKMIYDTQKIDYKYTFL